MFPSSALPRTGPSAMIPRSRPLAPKHSRSMEALELRSRRQLFTPAVASDELFAEVPSSLWNLIPNPREYQPERNVMNRLLLALFIVLPVLAQSPSPKSNSTKNAVGIEFIKVAPGEFMMGCSTGDGSCDPDEKPTHRVQITKGFEIGKFEVTQSQWQAVMGSNPQHQQGR